MIHPNGGNVYRQASTRTPVRSIHPANAPHVTAFIILLESDGNTVARSEGSIKRILRTPPSIAVDAGVLADLTRNEVDAIEVYIKDTKNTYTTTPENMHTYGQVQRRFGVQVILSLKYWGVNGDEPEALKPRPQLEPAAKQAALFDMPVTGRGAY